MTQTSRKKLLESSTLVRASRKRLAPCHLSNRLACGHFASYERIVERIDTFGSRILDCCLGLLSPSLYRTQVGARGISCILFCFAISIPTFSANAAPAQIAIPRLSSIVFPVSGPRLSSDYGNRKHPRFRVHRHHNGIDLAAPSGAAIRALSGGTVVFADTYAGYGNLVVIHHQNGLTSHYGHCQKIVVKTGQRVLPGAVLGMVGSTGVSTGPHLHLEIRFNGVPQDPLKHYPELLEGFRK